MAEESRVLQEKPQQHKVVSTLLQAEENEEAGNTLARQIIGLFAMTLLTIAGSMVAGYSAILLPQLQVDEYNIRLSKDQESWIASMAPLQMTLGCLFSSWCMDKFGPKRLNLFCCALAIVSWLILYLGQTQDMILVGRIIGGLYVGFGTMSLTSYLGEIAQTRYRGLFLSFVAFGIAFGVLLVHILGTFLTWKTTALIALILPLIAGVMTAYLPESHVWLMTQGRFLEARKSFYWFKGTGEEAKEEIGSFLEKYSRTSEKSPTLLETMAQFKQPEVYKPLIILNVFFTTTQFSGTNIVSFYSVELMQSTVPGINDYLAMILVDTIRVLMSIVASILTKRFKVRPLVFISGIGTILSLFALSLFAFLGQMYPENAIYTTIPIVFLVSYIVFISIGLVPLPWTLCGEILPPAMKGLGGNLSTAVNFFTFFIVIKTSPTMFDTFGTHGTFLIYGICVVIGTAIMYYILPETKNRTFSQIQDEFIEKKVCDKK